jgi:anti-anti-sigma factor
MAGIGPQLVIRTAADITVVTLQEPSILEAAMVERMGTELYRLVDNGACKKLILDFTKVKFLASGAVGVLINLHKKFAATKGKLVVCGLRKELTKVFEILKIEKLFTFCPDEAAALAVLGFTAPGPGAS